MFFGIIIIVFLGLFGGCLPASPQGGQTSTKAVQDDKYSFGLVSRGEYAHNNVVQKNIPAKNPVVSFKVCELSTNYCINPFYRGEPNSQAKETLFVLSPVDVKQLSAEDQAAVNAVKRSQESKIVKNHGRSYAKKRMEQRREDEARAQKRIDACVADAVNDPGRNIGWQLLGLASGGLTFLANPSSAYRVECQGKIIAEGEEGSGGLMKVGAIPPEEYPEVDVPIDGAFVLASNIGHASMSSESQFKAVWDTDTTQYQGDEAVKQILAEFAVYLKNAKLLGVMGEFVCLPRRSSATAAVLGAEIPINGSCRSGFVVNTLINCDDQKFREICKESMQKW